MIQANEAIYAVRPVYGYKISEYFSVSNCQTACLTHSFDQGLCNQKNVANTSLPIPAMAIRYLFVKSNHAGDSIYAGSIMLYTIALWVKIRLFEQLTKRPVNTQYVLAILIY